MKIRAARETARGREERTGYSARKTRTDGGGRKQGKNRQDDAQRGNSRREETSDDERTIYRREVRDVERREENRDRTIANAGGRIAVKYIHRARECADAETDRVMNPLERCSTSREKRKKEKGSVRKCIARRVRIRDAESEDDWLFARMAIGLGWPPARCKQEGEIAGERTRRELLASLGQSLPSIFYGRARLASPRGNRRNAPRRVSRTKIVRRQRTRIYSRQRADVSAKCVASRFSLVDLSMERRTPFNLFFYMPSITHFFRIKVHVRALTNSHKFKIDKSIVYIYYLSLPSTRIYYMYNT